jgi:hypothetical protein
LHGNAKKLKRDLTPLHTQPMLRDSSFRAFSAVQLPYQIVSSVNRKFTGRELAEVPKGPMLLRYATSLLIFPTLLFAQSGAHSSNSQSDPKTAAAVSALYGRLPLGFEPNLGQTDAQVKFLSRGAGYTLFLTGDEAVFSLHTGKLNGDASTSSRRVPPNPSGLAKDTVLRMKLRNAHADTNVRGVDELAGTSSYFVGNDPTKWRTNVPTYANVKYEGIYSGIDLVYHGNQRQLEYDFVVAPGANPRRICFDVLGVKRIRRDRHGELVFKMGEGEIRWHKPVAYQEANGTKQEIASRYEIRNGRQIEFAVGRYDRSRPLIIDPALAYSTYLGGSSDDSGGAIALDSSGNVYVTGFAASVNFPVTAGAYQQKCVDCHGTGYGSAFVAKFNPSLSALLYSTYLGGNVIDYGRGIAVSASGNAYVMGITASTDFPTTPGAYQGALRGNYDLFVTELNPSGTGLVYSTLLGGSNEEYGRGIALDGAGNTYVTGQTCSNDFPTTAGAFQTMFQGSPTCGPGDAFVSKLNATGSALAYSTYLGGSSFDSGNAIAVDVSGDAYVVGETQSTDFPITPGAFQTSCAAGCATNDAFVTELNPTGSGVVYSSYLGGKGQDYAYGIALDGKGDVYIVGGTGSSDFPVTPAAFQELHGGNMDAFVTEMNLESSSLVFSTYLGGSGFDSGYGISVDSSGNTYVTGGSASSNFPTTPGAFLTTYVGQFTTELNSTGSALLYSTDSLGGQSIVTDPGASIYITGSAPNGFPTTPGSFQEKCGSSGCNRNIANAIVLRIVPGDQVWPLVLDFGNQTIGIASQPQVTALTNSGSGPLRITSVDLAGPDATDFMESYSCGSVLPAGGSCNIKVIFTPVASGTRTAAVRVTYDAPNSPQTVALTGVGMTSYATTTTLLSSLNPSVSGKPVTFTATVSSPGTPSGKVEFLNAATVLATITLTSGSAKYTTTKLPPGSNTITAMYLGDANNNGSTSAPIHQFVLAATTTTLMSSPNPSGYGQSVALTATITSSIGHPPNGETVTFKQGATVLGTGALSGGTAKFSTIALGVGTKSLRAVYGGDSKFASSTSKPVRQVITKAGTLRP